MFVGARVQDPEAVMLGLWGQVDSTQSVGADAVRAGGWMRRLARIRRGWS